MGLIIQIEKNIPKKNKCLKCKGEGYIMGPKITPFLGGITHRDPEICPRCNGSGKGKNKTKKVRKYYYTITDYGGICESCLKEEMTVERVMEIHPWAKNIALVVK